MSKKPENRAKRFRVMTITNTVIALAVLALINFAISGVDASVDLTANDRFSVKDGTVDILKSLEAPVSLKYYVSANRPSELAALEGDIVSRLQAIADAAGPDYVNFDAANDVVVIEGSSADWLATHKGQRIREIRSASATGEWAYISNLQISHPALDDDRPLQLSLTRPDALEYRLALEVVKLRKIPIRPEGVQEMIERIDQPFTLTYFYSGQKAPNAGETVSPLPTEFTDLPAKVEKILHRIKELAKVEVKVEIVNEHHSPLLDTDDLYRLPKSDSQSPARGFYSTVFVTNKRGQIEKIKWVVDLDAAPKLITEKMWQMIQPQSRVGIYQPRERREYDLVESTFFHLGEAKRYGPDEGVGGHLQQLGYQVVGAGAGSNLITQELAALVVVRPSRLTPRDLYDLKAYLGAGGKVLLFHGTWHMGLMDEGLAVVDMDGQKDKDWRGTGRGTMLAKRLPRTLEGFLKELGVSTKGAMLAAEKKSLAYRVITPPISSAQDRAAQPRFSEGEVDLIPHAEGQVGGHILSSQIPALPLKAGSVFTIDQEKVKSNGLSVEALLRAPEGSTLITPKGSAEYLRFTFMNHAQTWRDAWSAEDKSELEFADAKDQPVAIMLNGQFPFDADAKPPAKDENDRGNYAPPGKDYVHAEGSLVVVGAPDLFEYSESGGAMDTPWGVKAPGLLSANGPAVEASRRRLLSNVLDTMVFGNELLEVRRALVPVPRRMTPWTASQKLNWTLLIVVLVPACVALLGLGVTIYRRRSRGTYERAAKALGRDS